jgi:hypothetical protein
LFDIENSSGSKVAYFDPNGVLNLVGPQWLLNIMNPGLVGRIGRDSGTGGMALQTAVGDMIMQAGSSAGNVHIFTSATGKGVLLGSATTITAAGPALVPLTVTAAAGQTADLFDISNSSGTVVTKFTKDGVLVVGSAQMTATNQFTSYPGYATIDVFGKLDIYPNYNTTSNSFPGLLINTYNYGIVNGIGQVIWLAAAQVADAFRIVSGATPTVLAGMDFAGRPYYGPAPSFGGGTGPMIFLGNDTTDPTSAPTGGTILHTNPTYALAVTGPTSTMLAVRRGTSGSDAGVVVGGAALNGDSFLTLWRGGGAAEQIRLVAAAGGSTGLNNTYVLDRISPSAIASRTLRFRYSQDGGTTFADQLVLTPTGQIALGGLGSFGGSAGTALFLANDTTDPTTAPAGGGLLYVSAGSLKYMGSSGTVTTLAPA